MLTVTLYCDTKGEGGIHVPVCVMHVNTIMLKLVFFSQLQKNSDPGSIPGSGCFRFHLFVVKFYRKHINKIQNFTKFLKID